MIRKLENNIKKLHDEQKRNKNSNSSQNDCNEEFKRTADKYNVLINDKLKASKPKFDHVTQQKEYTEELNRMIQNDDELDYDLTMELGEIMHPDTSLKENENKYFKVLKRKKETH